MENFHNFTKEIVIDTSVDQLNVLDRQMALPSIKHKWTNRLMLAKKSLIALRNKKKDIRKAVLDALEGNTPKGLPKSALDAKIESSDKIKDINDKIEETELLVEYLEKVEKILSSMTFDIKNITDLIKLETT